MASSRYVEVSAEGILNTLREVCEKVTSKGGEAHEGVVGSEIVYDLSPKGSSAFVRVYTSLARGSDAVRGCGEDAVRLIVISRATDRAMRDTRRIYRTAPKGSHEARERAFLDRLVEAIREEYREAKAVPVCPKCGKAMILRKPKQGQSWSPFYGCSGYPACKETVKP